ncbi:hypothetical protein LTR08_008396 [Meristemomyces frigidus]|nr:hypothetical protein LTR08_008396 [Meristemomyces frigidus]
MAASQQNEPIAVVGIGCRFPGGANSPSKLWDLLQNPASVAKRIPTDRFNLERFYHPDGAHHGTCNVTESYLLDEDVRLFDSGFFGVPPAEAAAMDPQHRLLMETVYEALESAGIAIPTLQGSDTAAYVGIMCSDYYILHAQDFNHVPTYNSTGIANSNASARLSYFFDWHGPCMTIDTACSSSLVAVHDAVQALRAGTSKVAVAAGTNLLLSPLGYISESKLGMLSPTGRCRMWDESADGYARGEGVAALIMKPLSQALADGDQIECVIRETGVNQDGKTKGITMPSSAAQAALIRDTYTRAGPDLHTVEDRCQYFEAHGTGTPAGDPQEAEALYSAFFAEKDYERNDVLYVGSVKTVIGHTEGTAGIAGIIKASLAMKHGIIPPNLLFNRLSPTIEPFYDNLEIVTTAMPWPTLPPGAPKRASVNSFGFGGTNAHAILDSYVAPAPIKQEVNAEIQACQTGHSLLPIVFSASSEKSLRGLLELQAIYLESTQSIDMCSLAYTLACRRSPLPHKAAFSAVNKKDLAAKIAAALSGDKVSLIKRSVTKDPSVLAIFTGQGAQWPQLGLTLIQNIPYARHVIDELDHSLAMLPPPDRPDWTIMAELERDAGQSRLHEAAIAQPVVCAVQLLLVDLLQQAGVKLRGIVGHSSGEIAAACAAGLINRMDAIRIAYYRGYHSGLAVGPTGQKGATLAVGTSIEDAEEFCSLEDFKGRLVVAASNSAASVTLSGDADAIEEAQTVFEDEDKFARPLRVDKAYHSHHMHAAAEPFLQSLQACGITAHPPTPGSPRWFSSVHKGKIVDAKTALEGQYWVDNLNGTVLFSQALELALHAGGPFDAVIEIGPHAALKGPASDVIEQTTGHKVPYSGTLARGRDDVESFAECLGSIWTNADATAVDFDQLHRTLYNSNESIQTLHDLPLYPWLHDRVLWSESRYAKLSRQQEGHFHDILGTRTPNGTDEEWRWRNVLSTKQLPWLTDPGLQGQTVFPATGYISLAMEAALQIAGRSHIQVLELTELSIIKAIAVDESNGTETLVTLTRIVRSEEEITALFACFSTASKDATQLALNANGRIRIQVGSPIDDLLAPRAEAVQGMVPVDPEHFFNEVDKIGYNYGPTFRGIKHLERKLGYSSGIIRGPSNDDTGTMLLFHPGMLDAALQGMLCGFSSPEDGRLWSLHAPSSIRRVTLLPSLCSGNMIPEVQFDCAITDVAYNKLTGDVEVFQSDTGYTSIAVEGVAFIPFSSATTADDRHLFAQNVWGVDRPDGGLALGERRATRDEITKAFDAERVAYYYLRALRESVGIQERDNLPSLAPPSPLRAIPMREGLLLTLASSYGVKDADFILTKASGEALPAVVRGETTILEHMTKDGKLDNYYKHALGFVELNRLIADVVGQISHRYPHMNLCEVGAGTGGATKGVIEKLGTGYTYTDISSGFFPNFASSKDRMIYRTLDITRDPIEQGFGEHTYDLVLAANVLHATPDLVTTLRNVRRLLKPGGYLVMMEVTNLDPMRTGLIIGALPGWWVGRESGRKYSPAVTLPQWHEYLIEAGSAGVDTSTPVLDPIVMPACILAAQAIQQDFSLLRTPLASSQADLHVSTSLVVIGGSAPQTGMLVDELLDSLRPRFSGILHARQWEDLDETSIPESCTVLCLSDCDNPFWEHMTVERFEKLKRVLLGSRSLLWVSHGSDCANPDGAMTYGFLRCLAYELPENLIQFIDLEEPQKASAVVIAAALLRLEVTAAMAKKRTLDAAMWTTEPEVWLRGSRTLIPRLYPEKRQNDRYNSAKREVLMDVDLRRSIAALRWNGQKHELREEETTDVLPLPHYRKVRMDSSLLSSIATPSARLFFGLGTDMDSGEHVLTGSTANASILSVPREWTTVVEVGRNIDVQYLSFLSGYLMSQYITTMLPVGGNLVVYEADPGLASLLSRQLDSGCSTILFITTTKGTSRRNWKYMHPRTADRHLAASLPPDAHICLDLSPASSSQASKALGSRIASMLPTLCQKFDASCLVAPQAIEPSRNDWNTVQQLLEKVNAFAAAQLNGVPDGMPLRMIPVGQLVSRGEADSMSVVGWRGETLVPVRVEPITCRRDLFVSDKTYWLVGLAGDMAQRSMWIGLKTIVVMERKWYIFKGKHAFSIAQNLTDGSVTSDISKRDHMHDAYSRIVTTMPPVAGVANGALVLRDKGLVNMDLETFHANTRCKVEGTQHLHELFPENTLDWFIAFSSISATVGNMGQMAYVAANSFMKALVGQRRRAGLAGSAIDISQIFGVGYIEREMKLQRQSDREHAVRLMHRSGTIIMSEPDLHQLFAEAVVNGRPSSGADHEIISGIKTITPAEAKDALWANNARFGRFIQNVGAAALPSVTKTAAVPVAKLLQSVQSEEEMVGIIKDAFLNKLKSSMMTADELVLATTPLIDLGVDSLVAVEIRSWFKLELSVDVAVLKILGGISAQELVEEAAMKLAADSRAALSTEISDESSEASLTPPGDSQDGTGSESPLSSLSDAEEGTDKQEH